uniref:Uncharacterized protein n=1 Tax=Candidatus Kentrum sp. SD TaxID=2126332 RepID=A0A450Y5S3_9GAMM|nr:MAG: hypothetical protein BECKSD772F_GA0070984_10075 [Candidatus Kentron sp. SD]VFK40513.1 MAG: hypothetical protein BECKSD772E_GA0070983_10074 [Candidatus Kentron sp. SD]VFK78361.1 MAG: hypothetical protein BECKSD772D_GA0070982_10135 [Candidatus Kentron sp. SD]
MVIIIPDSIYPVCDMDGESNLDWTGRIPNHALYWYRTGKKCRWFKILSTRQNFKEWICLAQPLVASKTLPPKLSGYYYENIRNAMI